MLNSPDGPAPEPAASLFEDRDFVRIDNTDLSPAEVARQVVKAFGLPVLGREATSSPG